MDVGFIGLGAMGSGMARNLIKAGHAVHVWNRSAAAVEALAKEGATAVSNPADAMKGEVLITMLADDAAVRAVVSDSLLDTAARNLIHVGCSTISVALARKLTKQHAKCGIGYVSAPVFGRPEIAAAGMLNIMAAGLPAAVSAVQPLLDAMGQKTWPLGSEPYRANVVKLAGNLMIAATIEAMAEATALGKAHGVDAADMIDIYSSTIFASPVYKGYGALIAERRYEPAGFKLKLGLKDVRLALQAGDAANVPLPFGSVLRDALIGAVASGDGEKDLAVLADVALARAGLKPT